MPDMEKIDAMVRRAHKKIDKRRETSGVRRGYNHRCCFHTQALDRGITDGIKQTSYAPHE